MTEFFPIFIFLIISLGLSLILVGIPFIVAPQKADPEKISAYECGFDPFDDARGKFDIRLNEIIEGKLNQRQRFTLYQFSICHDSFPSFVSFRLLYFLKMIGKI